MHGFGLGKALECVDDVVHLRGANVKLKRLIRFKSYRVFVSRYPEL